MNRKNTAPGSRDPRGSAVRSGEGAPAERGRTRRRCPGSGRRRTPAVSRTRQRPQSAAGAASWPPLPQYRHCACVPATSTRPVTSRPSWQDSQTPAGQLATEAHRRSPDRLGREGLSTGTAPVDGASAGIPVPERRAGAAGTVPTREAHQTGRVGELCHLRSPHPARGLCGPYRAGSDERGDRESRRGEAPQVVLDHLRVLPAVRLQRTPDRLPLTRTDAGLSPQNRFTKPSR